MLPAITPELMKSRRTHSLQLAIGEILHNRASVQSAATKYHIPRETLRRHYQRYLKAMGIAKQETLPSGRSQASTPTKTSPIETLAAAAAASGSNEETPSNYSSLLDIGQAYGIWNPGEDNSNDARDLKIVEDDEEEELDENATPESPKMLTQVNNLNFQTAISYPPVFPPIGSTNHPILGVRRFSIPHPTGHCKRLDGKQQQCFDRKIFGRAEGDSHGDCLTGISQKC